MSDALYDLSKDMGRLEEKSDQSYRQVVAQVQQWQQEQSKTIAQLTARIDELEKQHKDG